MNQLPLVIDISLIKQLRRERRHDEADELLKVFRQDVERFKEQEARQQYEKECRILKSWQSNGKITYGEMNKLRSLAYKPVHRQVERQQE